MKKKLIIWGIIIAALLVYFVGIPYFKMQKADGLFEDGKYEEAIEKYSELSRNMFFSGAAAENTRACQAKIAEEALINKDYDKALELYKELGLSDKVKDVKLACADDAAKNGEYKRAAEMYDELKEEAKAAENWKLYAEQCVTEKKFEEAVAIFEKLGDNARAVEIRLAWADELFAAGRGEEAPEVLKGCTGEGVAQSYFKAVKAAAEKDANADVAKVAGQYGAYITDVNTQLVYCNLLRGEEIDLNSVYPDGVVVDADLSQYQMVEALLQQNNSTEEIAQDYSKILVFSREEKKPDLTKVTASSSSEVNEIWENSKERKKNKDYGYTVRLEPGMMDSFAESMRANTLEESTCIVMLEKGYYPDNCLQIRSTTSYSGTYSLFGDRTTYTPYISYYAYEGIAIYNVNKPLEMSYYDFYANPSLLGNAVVGNSYQDSSLDLTAEQINEILEALEDKTAPESAEILAKYPKETVDFVEFNGWGNYIYIPEEDENGNAIGRSYSTEETNLWANEKYMLAVHEEGWMDEQIENNAIPTLAVIMLLTSME